MVIHSIVKLTNIQATAYAAVDVLVFSARMPIIRAASAADGRGKKKEVTRNTPVSEQ